MKRCVIIGGAPINDYNRIKNDVDGTVHYHEILGTKNIGIGGMPMDIRGSDEKTFSFILYGNSL